MALRDYEAFIRQCASKYDPDLDVSVGSSFDTQVVQPVLRRLGTDPFTVDLATFITERLVQAFPTMATKEGDALTDLLVKPATLLWDPFVREVKRVQQQLSLKDPTVLTLDEADSLGGNFFRPRAKGEYSKGIARVLFTQPQNVSVSPVNFFTAKGGLRFPPTRTQSIRTEEMLLNVYESYYYFDVNCIAEKPGTAYDIGPNELQAVANLPAAVRVINLNRFSSGDDEETAVEYIDRIGQELGEKSMVALRGIAAKLKDAFPEMNRLNVVGFGDPEMNRDVITGGGLGEIQAAGVAGQADPDGEGKQYTRRFYTAELDLTNVLFGDADNWVLTVFGATGPVVLAKDFQVRTLVDEHTLDLEEQEMLYGSTGLQWTLRKKELTLSGIPGGILFPDSANGTVSIPNDEVHVGGCYDVHTRGSGFDTASVIIEDVTDDDPLLSGVELEIVSGTPNIVKLNGITMGVDYEYGDETYTILSSAEIYQYALQILDGVDAGTYRIIAVSQVDTQPVELTLDPEPTNPGATLYRWRLYDSINVDLLEPKEIRLKGSDLRTIQGSTDVTTSSGIDFDSYGVADEDVLRVLNGPDAGDYGVAEDPLAPSFDWLRLATQMTRSQSNLQYMVFRPNQAGGVQLPLVRITSIDLLDSSKQPLGSAIPYAHPVDVQSRAFQNARRGVKHELSDVNLGLITNEASGGVFALAPGSTLNLEILDIVSVSVTATFAAGPFTPAAVASYINTATAAAGYPGAAVVVGSRVGIRPVVPGGVRTNGGTAMSTLFISHTGEVDQRSTADIICTDVDDWNTLDPVIDFTTALDIVQVMDGASVGYYPGPFTCLSTSKYILQAGSTPAQFAPENGRRIQVGSRSIGSARLYFLEPTSIEVDTDTRFTVEYENHILNFLPDPTLDHQRIPALPSGVVPSDGECADSSYSFLSPSTDFLRTGVRAGDKLYITTHPIVCTQPLGDPVSSLVYKTFVFSINGGPDRTLTFIRDDMSLNPDEVSRQSVIDQINALVGIEIASLSLSDTLQFDTEMDLIIRKTGTANSLILGDVADTSPVVSFTAQDVDNESPYARTSAGNDFYEIVAVAEGELTVIPAFDTAAPFSSPVLNQRFKVMRSGVQRICTTQMAGQQAEADLYYFDVELVSEGTGDVWNIPADLQMTPSAYRSDGYWLTTDDEDLAFSDVEKPKLILSRTILENGVDDSPANATQITGQNIQVNYERSELVSNIQGFASSETERVVCSNPLSRHLIPHFVRLDFTYTGGSKESVVIPDMEKYIKGLFPMDALESSDLQKVALDRGATSIQNPIDIIAVVHYPDRHIFVVRSQDSITTGRLAAFVPDVLNVVRRTA